MVRAITLVLECQICSEPFDEQGRKPKILPCHHTFCLQCMKQMSFLHGNRKMKIKCPYDNKVFNVSSNDVAQFPNDLTMMHLLNATMTTETGSDEALDSMSYDISDDEDDIQEVLARRTNKLVLRAAMVQNDIDKSPLRGEKEIKEARESISATFQEMKDRFVKAIEDRQAALMTELDTFSEKQKEKRSKELKEQLTEVNEFCRDVQKELFHLSDDKASRYLVRCVEMEKKTKSTFQDLKTDENIEGKAHQVQFKSNIARLNTGSCSDHLVHDEDSDPRLVYDINHIIQETGGYLILHEPDDQCLDQVPIMVRSIPPCSEVVASHVESGSTPVVS